jgi:predicted transcriptional regulator
MNHLAVFFDLDKLFGVESSKRRTLEGKNMQNNIAVPQTMLKRLHKLSENSGTTPAAIVKRALAAQIEYEEWELKQIDAGLADIKAGRVMSDADFWKSLESPKRGKKAA